jgi:hypothetical protein
MKEIETELRSKHLIKLSLSIDQIQSLIQYTELKKSEVSYNESKEWEKVRDVLAWHLDLITEWPFKDQ